jgi:hypothetical protein
MAGKKMQQRAIAAKRYRLDGYHIQMILDLGISLDSLARRAAKAWNHNRWTLGEYLEMRYGQEFGVARPKKPAVIPPLAARNEEVRDRTAKLLWMRTEEGRQRKARETTKARDREPKTRTHVPEPTPAGEAPYLRSARDLVAIVPGGKDSN